MRWIRAVKFYFTFISLVYFFAQYEKTNLLSFIGIIVAEMSNDCIRDGSKWLHFSSEQTSSYMENKVIWGGGDTSDCLCYSMMSSRGCQITGWEALLQRMRLCQWIQIRLLSERNNTVHMAFLDLQKAFDRVPYLRALRDYGVFLKVVGLYWLDITYVLQYTEVNVTSVFQCPAGASLLLTSLLMSIRAQIYHLCCSYCVWIR